MGTLTTENVDNIISTYETTKFGKEEYEKVLRMFIGGMAENIPRSRALRLMEILVSSNVKQIYLNEMKEWLHTHSEELYKKYCDAFHKNPGVFEAFGISGGSRVPVYSYIKRDVDVFKNLHPQLHLPKCGRRQKKSEVRRAIRRKAKSSACSKAIQEKKATAEYKRKMEIIHEKMRKNE